MTHANESTLANDYDDAGRLTAVRNLKSDSSVISIFTYAYDDVGNRTSVEEASGDLVTWTYDETYQLTREQRSGGNAYDVTYQYDAVGNRDTQETGGVTTSYSYDAANQLNTSEDASGVTTFTYDANGNTETQETPAGALTTYTWDVENMLTQVALPDASTATFTYDGDKRRRSKTEGGTATNFIRDGERVLLETDSGGTTQAQYTMRGPGWFDSLIAMRRSGTTTFYHFDALGSTDRLTDAAEDVTGSYTYKAFGQIVASSGSAENPFKYVGNAGYYRDPNTGLMQLGVRYYRTEIGRFISRERVKGILMSTGLGGKRAILYGYAFGNPITRIDPTGKRACLIVFRTRERDSNEGTLHLSSLLVGRTRLHWYTTAYSGLVGCGGESQCVQCKGPIPQGIYAAGSWQDECSTDRISGPCMYLSHGSLCASRSGFYIHQVQGDTNQSQGCIVLTQTNLTALRNKMREWCCTHPVPVWIEHPIESEGECTAAEQGLYSSCRNNPNRSNTCRVGCGAPSVVPEPENDIERGN